jgi:hypothetical protein
MREGEIKSAGMADSDQDSDRFRAGAVAFLDAYAGLHKLGHKLINGIPFLAEA